MFSRCSETVFHQHFTSPSMWKR